MVAGGMCGCRGVCVVARGHAWLPGGVHGKGVCMVKRGVCGKGGMCGKRGDMHGEGGVHGEVGCAW